MNRTLFHRIILPALAAAALALPAATQGLASSDVVRGCQGTAPSDSLRTRIPDPTVFRHDENAQFVIEAESVPTGQSWVVESSITGFAGASYLRWNGRNQFNNPGLGVMTYRLWCEQPQRFRLQMHNRHDHPDSSEENDCWMSINGASWRKIYSNDNRNARVWNWHTRVDPGHGWFEFDLVEGMNELRISGRSQNFKLDRMHIFPRGLGRLEDLSLPESARLGQRPVLGSTVRIEMGDPHAETRLPGGSTNTLLLISAAAARSGCGTNLPGFGIGNTVGELLLPLSPAPDMFLSGTWGGPTRPVSIGISVPNRPSLVGLTIHLQGVLSGTTGGALDFVLTDRLDLTIGDR
jgi:hypothetical protein